MSKTFRRIRHDSVWIRNSVVNALRKTFACMFALGLGLVLAWPAKSRLPDCVLWSGASTCTGDVLGAEPASDLGPQPAAANRGANLCELMVTAAMANGLRPEFFARLIWQESRFQPHAICPITRSGARALGIGQFMPRIAAERQLIDPLDPSQALPISAKLLRDLQVEFGNLGLAAAAYNAGAQRVRDWLAGKRHSIAAPSGAEKAKTPLAKGFNDHSS
jgi:hypothetical protein